MSLALVPALVIREMTGELREVRLTGRALPFRPFTLEGTQRADVTWLPGSPRATAQMLGPSEEPTTIQGRWCERFVGVGSGEDIGEGVTTGAAASTVDPDDVPASVDGTSITSVLDLVDLLDDVRRQGQLLEVSWGSHVRQGFLARFKQSWVTSVDVEWEAQFTWIGFAESPPPLDTASYAEADLSRAASGTFDDAEAVRAAADMLAAMRVAPSVATGVLPPKTAGMLADMAAWYAAIEDGVLKVEAAARGMSEAAEAVLDATLAHVDAVLRIAACADYVVAAGRDLTLLAQARVDALATGAPDPASVGAGQAAACAASTRSLSRRARRARGAAARRRDALGQASAPTPLAVVVAREGDDLRTLAARYYGQPDGWREIAALNGLASSTLVAGQVVVVPARGAAQGAPA